MNVVTIMVIVCVRAIDQTGPDVSKYDALL